MFGFGFSDRNRKPIDRKRSLEGIPVINTGLHVNDSDESRVVIIVFVKRREGFLGRFQPPIMERKVKLDAVGSFVFGLIDGKMTTRELISVFVKRYKVNRREAELSCVEFIKSLVSRNVVSIVIK